MIDAILSDRAEERRGLFEEAAGIGKYKDRRKAASRRLERAELDLQRLDDVIGEVESKVRSLSRQKGKAQRFQTLRDRRLSVEVSVVRLRLDSLKGRLDQVVQCQRACGFGLFPEPAHEGLIRQVKMMFDPKTTNKVGRLFYQLRKSFIRVFLVERVDLEDY